MRVSTGGHWEAPERLGVLESIEDVGAVWGGRQGRAGWAKSSSGLCCMPSFCMTWREAVFTSGGDGLDLRYFVTR